MTVDTLARLCAAMRGEVQVNEPLAGHTSLKVGGPADYFATPADLADLEDLLKVVQRLSLPCFVIGGGYNVLIGDGGFRGVVISLKRLNGLLPSGTRGVRVEAGVLNQQLVKYATDKGLSGLEFLSCIPGTVGGALSVNAGAHGQSLLGVVETLVTLKNGLLTETPAASLDYDYRYLKLEPGEVVVAASFSLSEGNPAEIRAKLEEFRRHRQESQKVSYPNAGSFFKNPEGQQAWRLIDEAGLRGVRIGGAQVAEAHTNFFVNRGGATAADFVTLADMIKKKVFERTGIMLQEEVRMLGDFEAH